MKKILLLSLLLTISIISFAQVSINTDGSNPNSSAMLDIKSDTAGILIPRMTATQRDAINNPAQGLLVFVSDVNSFYYYTGSSWSPVGRGTSGWEINNSTIYADSTHPVVIGTDITSGAFEVVTDKATGTYSGDKCIGGTASAMEHQSSYVAANAFDDDNLSLWRNNGSMPVWVQYDFGSANEKAIARYRMYWSGGSTDITPKDWQFQASSNGTSWTTLHSITGASWTNGIWKEYTFSNTTHFRYYRLNITANNGASNNAIYLNEIEMKEMTYTNHPTLFVANNKVGIGTETPDASLEVDGSIKYVDGNQAAGKILVSDANGSASWDNLANINDGKWGLSNDTLYSALDSSITLVSRKVGIGTNNPKATLHIEDGIMVTGTYGSGDTVNISGDGVRMFFNPRKAAFRAGVVDYTDSWDNGNIGDYSFASGINTKASGSGSVAMGESCTASGYKATALGFWSEASGIYSFAVGNGSHATGQSSTALCNSYATGAYTIATGGSHAWGDYSTALGQTDAKGNLSTAMGGYFTSANAEYSFAEGRHSITNGKVAVALGAYLTSNGFASTVVGLYNDTIITRQSVISPSTPLFIVGNGSYVSTSNALVVRKDGHIGLGTNTPNETLEVNGHIRMTDGNQAAGNILVSDANGSASWANGDTLSAGGWKVSGDTVYNMNSRIGIGTSSPTAKLEINDSTSNTTLFIHNTNNSNNKQYGNYSEISGSGTGDHIGSYSHLAGYGNGIREGFSTEISNGGSGTHYGFTSYNYSSGSGEQIGIFNSIHNSGDGVHYGNKSFIWGNGNGDHYGSSNFLDGSGSGKQFGVNNYIANHGNGDHYGIFNSLRGGGSGNKYGSYDSITSGAGGTHYGVYSVAIGTSNYAGYFKGNMYVQDKLGIGTNTPIAKMEIQSTSSDTTLFIHNSNNSNDKQYGSITNISGSGNGEHYGASFTLDGTGTDLHCGISSYLGGSGTGTQIGSEVLIANPGNGVHYGASFALYGSGSGTQYGIYNSLLGSGSGTQFGSKVNISNSGNGMHYGAYSLLSGSGSGNKYGTYDTIPTSTGGTHYGVYSVAEGASNYAGYFKGNVNVTEKIKAPASGDADLKAYIYGSLDKTTGSFNANESTTGFSSTLESTGVYKITFTNSITNNNYLIVANALSNSPVLLTYEKIGGYFRIRAWNLSGSPVNTYLNFVVYKK